jgi:phenylalanine-4-hydroxylase
MMACMGEDLADLTPITPDGQLGPADQHPGIRDREYRRRRHAVTAPARGHQVGDPAPLVSYTESEHATWRAVHAALVAAYEGRVCPEVLAAREEARLPPDRVPQLSEVGARLRSLTGFDFTPAGGPVRNRRFLGALAEGYFHAAQYVRHPAMPLYTPEPDIIHDVFGHGAHLASPWFADLYRLVGAAAARAVSEDTLDLISRVYWFSLEYGVVADRSGVRAYGAALLTSYGELRRLRLAGIRGWDITDIARTSYRTFGYQPVLFGVRSLDHLADALHEFLNDVDEDTGARLGLPTTGP